MVIQEIIGGLFHKMITIFVPAYNEGNKLNLAVGNIIATAERAGNVVLDIVIVNDGSTDNTKNIIKRLEKKYAFVRSIHHQKNQGIGVGAKKVLSVAKYGKFMIVPGNNDVSQDLLYKLFKHRNKAEMVLSFYLNKELRGRLRNVISVLYGLIYMTVFNVFVQYYNGVGVYPTEKIKQLKLRSKRLSIVAELNTKMLCTGCTLYEIPGYMQLDPYSSNSVNFCNLAEVMVSFLRLLLEIKFIKRNQFNKQPVRIQ